jgi:hypothetical protein
MHFQVWHDKVGNAPSISDDTQNLSFPDLNAGSDPNRNGTSTNPADDFQTNLIMPEPTFFLHRGLEAVSIIRPTDPAFAARGAVKSFVDDGLFIDPNTGSQTPLAAVLMELAEEADEARRRF